MATPNGEPDQRQLDQYNHDSLDGVRSEVKIERVQPGQDEGSAGEEDSRENKVTLLRGYLCGPRSGIYRIRRVCRS
jgi:hypothetical protein